MCVGKSTAEDSLEIQTITGMCQFIDYVVLQLSNLFIPS